ncbi:YadA-like family protein [Actinobacillus equuli]|uniref:YadA-like family protein n=1 Tax=Actinobacillus equuli TaxID=718 RepID=UPI002442FD51|nr:YadA-like family protein [Actinobacillus equuli]WGE56342.1 YadA-like family protein [Actinobacillus equuli subsp. equuli]
MNHIYKVVWSTVTNSLVVVSELARSKGKAASTVSDVKDVSNKTAAVAVAAALQVAAVGTIAIGSFAPMEANAIVAIGGTSGSAINSATTTANADRYINGVWTADEGTRPYNYNNPGSLSYNNPNQKPAQQELYDNNLSHGIAIGCHTNVIATTGKGGSNGIAIGDYAQATGGLSVSVGAFSKSTDVGAMALGTSSRASGFNSLAMMRQSAATGDYAVAIGSVAYAKGSSSFAMGSSATAMGNQSIAIGSVAPHTLDATGGFEAKRTAYDGINNTQTNGERSLAIGSAAKTNGDDSFAVGTSARTGYFGAGAQAIKNQSADQAIAFGNDSEALKDKAIAFGNNASAKGEESVAFGINATTNGTASVAIGTNSTAGHDRVVTIGTNSTATHNRSMAIGEEAKALENHSLALGANAIVTVANSVSLGADSNADEIGGQANMTINGRKYDFAGLQAKGTVSVGSGVDKNRPGATVRTITDVGAGRVSATSTDAINGSQLYALATEVGKGWNVATSATADGVKTGDQKAANVINDETVTFTAGKNIVIDQKDQTITVATKDDVDFKTVNSTTVTTTDLTAKGDTTVHNFTVSPNSKIDMGNNRVTNIAAPQDANDATTKQYVDNGRTQVKSTDKSVTIDETTSNGAKVYDLKVNANVSYEGDSGKGTNKLSDPIKFAGVAGETVTTAKNGQVTVGLDKKAKDSLDKADTAVQTVLVGAGDKTQSISVDKDENRFDIVGTDGAVTTTIDGRNVKVDIDQKFKDTVNTNTQNIVKNENNIAENTKNITNNANNITKNAEAIAKGFGLEAQDGKTVNKQLGQNISVVGQNSNIKTSVDEGKVKIALNNTLDLTTAGSVKIGETKVDGNGLTITGGPSVTKTGINAGGKTITDVADGKISEDSNEAVNGSQLHKTNQNVTKNTTDITNLNNTVQEGWELRVEGNKAKDVTPKDKVANFKAGDNINVSIATDKSVVIATDKDVIFDNVKTQNLNVEGDTNVNNFTVKTGSTVNMGDNVVNGVANGTVAKDSKDAVNGGQLFATNQNVTNLDAKVNGGFGLQAADGKAVTKQLGEKIEVVGGDKNISTTVTADNKLTINLNKDLDLSEQGSVKVGDTTINNGGLEIVGGPSVKKDGINAGDKKITNVEAGEISANSKDAVNGSQLHATNQNVTNLGNKLTAEGLNFVGDNKDQKVHRNLGETLSVVGGAKADLSENNIGVEGKDGTLTVKLAKTLKDLTNATFTTADNGNTVIDGKGVTITPANGGADKTVSLTDKGLNNGNNKITNVSAGTDATDAVNVSQLEKVNATAKAGWNLAVNDEADGSNIAPNATVRLNNKDGNIKVTREGNNVTFDLNNTVKVGTGDKAVTINGTDGTVTGLTNKTFTPGQIVSGRAATEDQLQSSHEQLNTNITNLGNNLTEKGLSFSADNKGAKVHRKLGETLSVVGNADPAKLSDKNIGVEANEANGQLVVKLAKELTDLTSANFTATGANTTINGNGVTITPKGADATKTVSLTDKGLNNGNNQITNVTSGLTDSTGKTTDLANATSTNAVNVGDLKETVKNITTDGFGLKDDKGTEVKQDLGKTIQIKGKDGVTVTSNVTDKSLEVALAGDVVVNGKDGKDGTIGVKGADGKDGTTITKDAIVFNGVDGVNGKDGKDGAEGKASIKVEKGAKGIDGNDGKDGESKTRIVYEKPNGDKEEVATLNDGLYFVGDNTDVTVDRKLGKTLSIVGNADLNALSDKNIGIEGNKDNGQLVVKLAKVLTDLTSANFTDAAGNNTIIGGNGVTITPKAGDSVSLTGKGLNNGNNTITNVKAGLNGTDAVNVNQLEKVNATAKAGWKLTNNGTNESTVTPNATVDLANKDGNIIITKDGNNVTFGFNSDLTVGGPGKDGKDGKDGSIGVKGKDGTTGVTLNGKDGSIGLTGAPGKDGKNASANITVAQGAKGLDGNDGVNGESKTRIVYEKPNGEKEEVATLKDGLNFVGNDGKVVDKKLNDTLAIKGGINTEAGLTAASDRNVGVRKNNDGLNIVIAERPTFSGIIVDGKDGKDAEVKFAKDGKDGMSIVGTRGADGQNGLTLKGANGKDGVSFKEDGRITNVADGKDGKDAVNKDQLERVNATAKAGWKLTINNGNNQTTVTPNATVDLANTDGNIVITKVGNNVNFGLNNTLTVGNDNKPGTMTVKGENGKDGVSISGKDGISIKGENGQDAVSINGKDGNGAIAVNGKDGKTGVGLDGANGTIGINGKDGSNGAITVEKGAVGVDGTDGANGKDGMTRIVYTDANGTKHNVSTLNDGLSFVGDTGNPIAKKLNQTLTIKGNLDVDADVTDKNLRVDNVGGALIIKMARTLTDLTSATFTNAGGDKSVVDGNGLTITPINGGNKVSLTTKGLDNGGNKVINVAAGDVNATSTDAVNGSQLYAVSEVAKKGWNIQTNGNVSTNVKPGDTVNFANGDNIKITNNGTKVTVGLAKDVDLGEKGSIKAGDTIMNNDGVKVGDKVSLTKDGLTAGDVKISAETGINAGNKQITNVESGLGGTKLADAKGDTLKNAANIGDLQTAISGVTDAEQGGGFGLADDNGTEVKQSLGKTIQVKGDGNVTTTVTNGSLTVGLNKDVDLGKDGSLTAGGTKVSEKGVSFADSLVNLTSDGLNNGGNKVTNVKAGEVSATSTDAVNGSQLHATNQNVTNVQNTVAKGWNIEAGTVEGSTGKVTGASKSKVAMGDTVGMKAGNNIEITQDGSNIAIATSATPTFDTVTVGKDGNTATVGTVKDKHGSAIKVTGADGKSETRINNVADGKADNDAVNVRQLKGVAQNVANIDNRVSKLDKRVRGIGANSAAASSLPQVMLPGKSMVAVAGGAYSGASAVAVGYSRASDNGKVILKVNGTANSAGHYSGGVGVGFQW